MSLDEKQLLQHSTLHPRRLQLSPRLHPRCPPVSCQQLDPAQGTRHGQRHGHRHTGPQQHYRHCRLRAHRHPPCSMPGCQSSICTACRTALCCMGVLGCITAAVPNISTGDVAMMPLRELTLTEAPPAASLSPSKQLQSPGSY